MPAPEAERATVYHQLTGIKGLPADVVEQMMAAYDQAIYTDARH